MELSRATQWAIADGLRLIPKDGPEICHHNFDPPQRRLLPRFVNPRGINLNGNLEDIAKVAA